MISNIVKNIVNNIVSPIRIPVYRFTIVTTVPNETFTPPFEITGTYDCNINWGDGSNSDITVWDHADTIHKYATPGTYEVAITGIIIGWHFNNGSGCALYYETKSWGSFNPGNSGGAFYGCSNHTITATDIPDFTGVTSLYNYFRGNTLLAEITSLNSWELSSIITFYYFLSGTAFNQSVNLNTPAATNMNSFFRASSMASSVVLVTNLVTDMTGMFMDTPFDQDLSGMDITSLTNATNFLLSVTLSVANYNALILSWSPQAQVIVMNFHGGNSKYTGGGVVEAARDAWIAKGTTITDGGPV